MSVMEIKAALRECVRRRMALTAAADRATASARACSLLVRQAAWQRARAILFFAPLADEPDLWPLVRATLEAGGTAGLPQFDATSGRYTACRIGNIERDVVPGRFGVREPAAGCAPAGLDRWDLILVPGVAFDVRGGRLGRGQGFYDQLLADLTGTRCGVAFDEQIVEEIPMEPHDARLDCVLTPTRWIEV